MAKLNFNPASAEKLEERGAMPAGEYLFSITESEVKPGRKPGADVLGLTYTCLADGFRGRKMWQYINIKNPSAEAQKIGQGELRAICEAVGLGNQVLDDTVKLHNIPMLVKIKIDKQEGYNDSNKPTFWKPAGAASNAGPGGFKPPVGGVGAPKPFAAPVASSAASPAPFAQPAQAPAQQALEQQPEQSEQPDSTTSTTTSHSDQAAAPAAGGAPKYPWMKKA